MSVGQSVKWTVMICVKSFVNIFSISGQNTTYMLNFNLCKEYKELVDENISHILVDVRPNVELEICHLQTSDNFLSILIWFSIKLSSYFDIHYELNFSFVLTKYQTDIPIRDIENNKNLMKIRDKISTTLARLKSEHKIPLPGNIHLSTTVEVVITTLNYCWIVLTISIL